MKFDPALYLVTDSTGVAETIFLNKIDIALQNGVTMLQLREKEKSTAAYFSLAQKVKMLTDRYKIPLIIDDRVDVAMAVGAGVHLGAEDLPVAEARRLMGEHTIIGATAKTVDKAKEVFFHGADYIGAGAIYPTSTKVKTVITPVDTIKNIAKAVPIPVMAIGGLAADNLHVLAGSGIKGICVVSAIMKADDTALAVQKIKKSVEKVLDSQ